MVEPTEHADAGPDVRRRRLHSQRLASNPLEGPEQVVRWLGAVQAQDPEGAKWAVAQRTGATTTTEIERLLDEGRILRTHLMRPTWHLVLPEDLRWILALTADRTHRANSTAYRNLGLDAETLARGDALLAEALGGGRELTRPELGDALAEGGISAEGTRLAHLVMHAELEALVCSGRRRDGQPTYALVDERVPPQPPLDRDEALAELARRYFTSHGPATVADFAWWSGLTVRDARAGLGAAAPLLVELETGDGAYWAAADARDAPAASESPVAHLLPNYDEHVVAYRDRSLSYHPRVRAESDRPDALLSRHAVAVDGLVVGTWRRTAARGGVRVEATLHDTLGADARAALEQTSERYAAFLERPVWLEVSTN